ncbi:MAG: hypothetical protein RMJ66_00540 [Bacteroidia bacterium]|nr:hypothetical protein [Bacteroidia bacterium]MDW8133532.1 hypothetical protein [Bacteroidia bacterium]
MQPQSITIFPTISLLVILLEGCKPAPGWLAEAPLIGTRLRDDAGNELYLRTPPSRVALCTPEAIGLWQSAGLFSYVKAACVGEGDDPRIFYLPCGDSIALSDALFRNRVEWAWVPSPQAVESFSPDLLYVFAPRTLASWLRHMKNLAKVYDQPLIKHTADSLERIAQQKSLLAKESRVFKVAILTLGEPLALLSQRHPLATLVQETGGSIPYKAEAEYFLPHPETLYHALPDIILVPENSTELLNDFLRQYPDAYTSPAIRYKRVFSIPPWFIQRPFSNPVQVFFTLLQIIHPELVGNSAMSPAREQVEDTTE